jgi:uncharacterized protein
VTRVVDCNVHPPYPGASTLMPHLSERWQEFMTGSGFRQSPGYRNAYPVGLPTVELKQTDAGDIDVSLDTFCSDVLEPRGADLAILNCYYGVEALRHPDWSAALAGAVNDWLVTEWLQADERLRASIVVDPKYPDLAAEEIRRSAGSHDAFVQVLLPVRSETPYGNRSYDRLYEAAVEHGLVLGLHFGGMTGNPPGWVGWPTYYYEEYVGMTAVFQSQVTSLITEGTFERFPTLRVAVLEGGWTWLPSLMWRLDKDWKGLRRETPWVKELPSTYVRKHFRFGVQPVDAPREERALLPVVRQLQSDDLLMFGSDYPLRQATDVDGFLAIVSSEQRDKIMGGNAHGWYEFSR